MEKFLEVMKLAIHGVHVKDCYLHPTDRYTFASQEEESICRKSGKAIKLSTSYPLVLDDRTLHISVIVYASTLEAACDYVLNKMSSEIS